MKWNLALRVMLTANLTFLTAVAVFLLSVVSAAYLQPDPLAVVVETLEEHTANQTAALKTHLTSVTALLDAHTAVLTRLASFLDAEEGRGARLRRCLEDPASC